MKKAASLLFMGLLSMASGCSKQSASAPSSAAGATPVVQAGASARDPAAAPAPAVAAKPQHLEWQLYLLEDENLRGGMTKQEIERALFSDERSSRGLGGLTCTKPFEHDKQHASDVVVCQTIGWVQRGASRIPVKLEFDMSPSGELSSAMEAFPVQLADDARTFLSARFGEPTSYAPTSWKMSAGCGHTGEHPPGQCATIALFTSDVTQGMSNEDFGDWGTIEWTDFLSSRDLEEAQKQPTTQPASTTATTDTKADSPNQQP